MPSATLQHSLHLPSTGLAPPTPFNQRSGSRTVSARNTVRASSASNLVNDALCCWNNRFALIRFDHKRSVCLGGTLAFGIATGIVVQLASPPGGGIGGGWLGGWGGGGDGGGNFWSRIGSALAAPKKEKKSEGFDKHGMSVGLEIPMDRLLPNKRYKISSIELFDKRKELYLHRKHKLFEMISVRPGGIYKTHELQEEYKNIRHSGMFSTMNMVAIAEPDGTIKIHIKFSESMWKGAHSFGTRNMGVFPNRKKMKFNPNWPEAKQESYVAEMKRIENAIGIAKKKPSLFPSYLEARIGRILRDEKRVTATLLQHIRNMVQNWYHANGFACAQVVNFTGLNKDMIVAQVVEGIITHVDIQFLDKMGNICEGNTQESLIQRVLPDKLWIGYPFNIIAGREALRNLNGLALFANIEINPKPDEKLEGGIIVEVKLKELDQKTAEVNTEWGIAPGSGGRLQLASIQPGGSVTFEHRNLKGLNRSILGLVTSSNLFNPQDDLGFKMEYIHPYLDGVDNEERDRTFRTSCFNSRKLSPVFTGGPGLEEVPAIWVDRAGIKANITENFSRQSKFTFGAVIEEITTRDETSTVCTNGARALPNGALSMDGPPTTLSGTGIDHMAFLQANITRDNTAFFKGTTIGSRDVFQLDQGLGIGSKSPLFNRHQMSMTRFIPIVDFENANEGPPPVMVFHGRYGGCVGDLPSYDAFTLGGPYSVRGYNMGELGACRNILELAAELRLPVRNTHAYAFAEYGTDLGSSKDVKGNPTEYFRRAGHGAAYGLGVRLGLIRAEYAVDHNAGTGSILVRFGDRF